MLQDPEHCVVYEVDLIVYFAAVYLTYHGQGGQPSCSSKAKIDR